jgi:hypothetical protein
MIAAQRRSCSAFKRVVRCCSYAASPSFGARYDYLDKALDNPCCFLGRYVMTRSNQDIDIFQSWVWRRFKTQVVIRHSRFL